jgi:putative ABC transport system permease protein
MKSLRAVWLRFAGMFSRQQREEDFAAELESHVQMQIEDNVRGGMSPEEARRVAVIKLGGVEQTKQAYRERGTVPFLEGLNQDVRFALRQFAKHPGFALTTVFVLAIGIGAATAIFSAVYPVVFKPLPYPDSRRLTMVWEMGGGGAPRQITFGTFHGVNDHNQSFESTAVMRPWQPAILDNGEPERLEGQRVSANYFRVLGVEPAFGRNFEAANDRFNGPNVVILSDSLWRRRFAADPGIVGRSIKLGDALYTVLGVMPSSFENVLASSAQLWAPLQYDPSLPADGREWGHHLTMIGRLQPGVGMRQASNELTVIVHALAAAYAKGYDSSGGAPDGMQVHRVQDDLIRDVKPALLVIMAAVGLLLVIACVNVTNLMLARGAQRQGELATRAALGARPARLIRQLLTESILLALGGGALGLLLARGGVRVLVALAPVDLPRAGNIRVDTVAYVFAFAIAVLVGVAVGMVPALYASRRAPQAALKESSRTTAHGHQVTRCALVVSEIAVALVLLVSTGLLLRSIEKLFAVPPGFDPAHLLTMQVQNPTRAASNNSDNPARVRLLEQVLLAVRQVPGVTAAEMTSQLPLSGDLDTYGAEFEGDAPGKSDPGYRYSVSPGYFAAMKIPLRRGRLFTEADHAGQATAVLLSESLAKRKFHSDDAIGRRLRIGADIGRVDRPWATVVGVVGDVKQASLALDDDDAFYIPTAQWRWVDPAQSLVIRTKRDAVSLVPSIRQAIWSVDKDMPIVRIATMENLVAASEAQRHFVMVLFEAFALASLLLVATGIYGVLAGSVSERTREIGVRAALGASPANILRLIFGQGMLLAGFGALIGLAGASVASRALTAMLFGTSPLDPRTYLGVMAVLLAVAAVACWIPARRAANIDPAITLRAE